MSPIVDETVEGVALTILAYICEAELFTVTIEMLVLCTSRLPDSLMRSRLQMDMVPLVLLQA